MQTLLIEVDGRLLRFDQPLPIRIGRSIDADVVLPAMTVSRAHAEIRPTGQGWVLVDVGSGGGTWVDGVRIGQRPVTGVVHVQLGPSGPGSTITITPEALATGSLPAPTSVGAPPAPVAAAVPATPPGGGVPPMPYAAPDRYAAPAPYAPPSPASSIPQAWDPPVDDLTRVPGMPAPGHPGAQPAMTGPDLLVVGGGREHRYRHPAQVSVGRAPENDVVIADQACSRHHGRIVAVPGGWLYQNLSAEGTYDQSRPVQQERIDETVRLRLGHPIAGPELAVIPILSAQEEVRRAARKRRNRVLLRVGVVAAVLVLIAGVVGGILVLTNRGGDSEAAVQAARDHAKSATVLITYTIPDAKGGGEIIGSGSLLTSDGLILTNAHVAAPQTPALKEIYGDAESVPDPDYLEIHLTDPSDGYKTGDPDYRARVVEADGTLDAAVIKIYADGDGNPVDGAHLGLPSIPLGDSTKLETGDEVTILGFPGIARMTDEDPLQVHPGVTVTTGVVSTFVDTERIGPDSEIDTDARIAPGNSGGAAIDAAGQLIGVPSSYASEQNSPIVSGRIRPISYLMPLISRAESQDK